MGSSKTSAIGILTALLTCLVTGVPSAADASPPPLIAETWSCSLKKGKDVEDVLKVRDFRQNEADKTGLTLPSSFLWTLVKGEAPIDHVWFNVHRDFEAYGASADTFEATGIGSAVTEPFSKVSDCVAGMSSAQMIFSRGTPEESVPDGPMFIAAIGCTYVDGKREKSLPGLIANIRGIMEGMNDNAPAYATALTPFTLRAPGAPDVYLYSGFENATGWSNHMSELRASDAGKRLRQQMASVLECDGATIWSGQRL